MGGLLLLVLDDGPFAASVAMVAAPTAAGNRRSNPASRGATARVRSDAGRASIKLHNS